MAMTLIVLAATMGNKYGGLKQLDGIYADMNMQVPGLL